MHNNYNELKLFVNLKIYLIGKKNKINTYWQNNRLAKLRA